MRHTTSNFTSCRAPSLPSVSLPTEDPRDATFLARTMSSASQASFPVAASLASSSRSSANAGSPSSSSSSHKVCRYDTQQWSADGHDWYRPTTSRGGPSSRSSSSRPSGSNSSHTTLYLYDRDTPSSSDYGYPPPTYAPLMRHVTLPPDTQLYPLPSPPSSPTLPSSSSLSSSSSAAPYYGIHQGHHHQSHGNSLTLHSGLTHFSYDVRRPPATARFLFLSRRRDALHLDTHSRPFGHTTPPSSSPLPFPHSTYATSPPTSSLILSLGPYTIPVYASGPSPTAGVTCGDIITALYQFLQQPLNQTELHALQVNKTRVFAAYWKRMDDERRERGTTGQAKDMLRNLDALMGETEVLRVVLRTGKRCTVETRKPDE